MFINIFNGTLSSGENISGTFPLIEPVKPGYHNGLKLIGIIDTSSSSYSIRRRNARVIFETRNDFNVVKECDNTNSNSNNHTIGGISDDALINKINDTFDTLHILSEAATKLKILSLIVSGTAGTGKTFSVMKAIQERQEANPLFYYEVIKGSISPIGLYMALYRAKDGVLVIDDSDSAFTDPEALQFLKAATESTNKRLISYRKLSRALEGEGIPDEFIFKGCVIILTNSDLENPHKSKVGHYEALLSRAHFINAQLNTDREKLLRIKMVIKNEGILDEFLDKEYHDKVFDFIDKHHKEARELSLRTVVKIAELVSSFPDRWEKVARATLLTR